MRYDSSIVQFQQKRGGDSAAFFIPFLTPDMILLDAGCGPGTITAALAGFVGRAVGVDIAPKAIAAANELAVKAGSTNLAFVEADMTALPFEDGSFDAVFFHAVLYHQSRSTLMRTLAEARRVLKPGGFVATRDADAGGNILHPEIDGVHLALDLWQRWYEHVEPGRSSSAVGRVRFFAPTASRRSGPAPAMSTTVPMPSAAAKLLPMRGGACLAWGRNSSARGSRRMTKFRRR
ncbi:class I SAM-dependent methyltransferase [Bradyrhizobium sp. WSM2793]|uniref:class I SAM-dependent methyltransferase n=1 Tax=Bradyrhizobium sp. WSM2793 TaxID=1038866 RepID=UPI00039FA7A4|nr:class I SAM-dependent methyltransferase [Bradyrhizobium sp. WSM2793]